MGELEGMRAKTYIDSMVNKLPEETGSDTAVRIKALSVSVTHQYFSIPFAGIPHLMPACIKL